MNWWQRLRSRGRLEDELDAELRFHFDRLVADYVAEGLPERDALRRARQEFGGVEAIKDDCRDARGTRWAHDLAQDVRFAARLLLKDRSFTVIAVLALALGIGVNNTLFTVVNALCIRGLPVDAAGRVVDISNRDRSGRPMPLSRRQFEDLLASLACCDRRDVGLCHASCHPARRPDRCGARGGRPRLHQCLRRDPPASADRTRVSR